MSARATEPYPLSPEARVPPGVAGLAADQGLGRISGIYAPKMANWFIVIALALMGILTCWLLVGFYFLWMLSRTPRISRKQAAKRVYVFDNGFIDAPSADQLTVYRWDQIATVFQFIQNVRANGIKASIRLARGYIHVRRTGSRKWIYHAEARRIPNLAVLMTLAERSTRAAVPSR
jgi:hypothetical protein